MHHGFFLVQTIPNKKIRHIYFVQIKVKNDILPKPHQPMLCQNIPKSALDQKLFSKEKLTFSVLLEIHMLHAFKLPYMAFLYVIYDSTSSLGLTKKKIL